MTVPPTAVATLRTRMNAGSGREADLVSALALADALLTNHVGGVTVPDALYEDQLIDVAGRIIRLRSSEAGRSESPVLDGIEMTINVDPLHAARKVLAPFLGPGIA